MKKLLMAMLATVSLSSAAVGWGSAVHIKEVWIAPGPTPVVRITTDAVTYPVFAFYLNPTGNAEMLKIAQDAIADNLLVLIYGERGAYSSYSTGMSAPNITGMTGMSALYSLTFNR